MDLGGRDLLAGAGACARREPCENIALGVEDATGAGRREETGAGALVTVLLPSVASKPGQIDQIVSAQWALLGGVVEQLAKLLEGHVVGLHGQCLSASPPMRRCKKGSR